MRKNKLMNSLWYVIPILLIIAGIAWLGSRPRPGDSVLAQGNQHIDTVDSSHTPYSTVPPTSGPHVGGKSSWGVSGEQIADEIQIHNLEDGGVIVHYDPAKIQEDTIGILDKIVRSYKTEVILEPYSGLQSMIALTAWGRIQHLDQTEETQIRAFIDAYKGIDHHARK